MKGRRKKRWILWGTVSILVCAAVLLCRPFHSLVEMDPEAHQYWSVVPYMAGRQYQLEQEEVRQLYEELSDVLLLGPLPPKRGYSGGGVVSLYTAQGGQVPAVHHTIELFLERADKVSINIDDRGYLILSGHAALRDAFHQLSDHTDP